MRSTAELFRAGLAGGAEPEDHWISVCVSPLKTEHHSHSLSHTFGLYLLRWGTIHFSVTAISFNTLCSFAFAVAAQSLQKSEQDLIGSL